MKCRANEWTDDAWVLLVSFGQSSLSDLISNLFLHLKCPALSSACCEASLYISKLNCVYFPGEYAGFDESQPTAESGGKGKVISMLKEQYGFKTMVMIGDGATDLEASPPAVSIHINNAENLPSLGAMVWWWTCLFHPQSAFIGFGGNVTRQQVKEKSSWYVTSFGELLKELEKI